MLDDLTIRVIVVTLIICVTIGGVFNIYFENLNQYNTGEQLTEQIKHCSKMTDNTTQMFCLNKINRKLLSGD